MYINRSDHEEGYLETGERSSGQRPPNVSNVTQSFTSKITVLPSQNNVTGRLTAGWFLTCLTTDPNMDGIADNLPTDRIRELQRMSAAEYALLLLRSSAVSDRAERTVNGTLPPLLSTNRTTRRQQLRVSTV